MQSSYNFWDVGEILIWRYLFISQKPNLILHETFFTSSFISIISFVGVISKLVIIFF